VLDELGFDDPAVERLRAAKAIPTQATTREAP
jgi:hypothetical protein